VPATDDVYLSTTTDTGVLCRQERMRAGPKTPCATSGTACNCWMRQDNATSYCSVVATGPHLSCAPCTAGQICVVLGGKCSTGYGCVTPCPNPK